MAAVEDEIDFSSYLVDIDDDGGSDHATNITNAAFASSSYANPSSLLSTSATAIFSPSTSSSTPASSFQPSSTLQTHSAKNWPAGLIQQHRHIGAVTPSPPESASDSSFKASTTSTAGTAPSSIASTSYPDSASSWGTQKTFINNTRQSHTSTASSSLASSVVSSSRPSALSSSRKASSTSADHTPPASSSAGNTASSKPAINLSFNYDFAHNPALNEAFSPSSQNQQAPISSSFQDTFDPAQYSASLPSASSSRQNSLSSRHGSSDRLSSMNNQSTFGGKPLSPSSGPQHVSKGHRNRQSSSASTSMSTSLGSSAASPHWLSMTPATPSISIPQFASTPYSRPVAVAMSTSDIGSQIGSALTGQTGSSYTSSGLSKRPSKRRTTPGSSSANVPQLQPDTSQPQNQQAAPVTQQVHQHIQQYPLNTTSNYLTESAPGMQQFGFPIPGQSYRDPGSVITSPVSPSLDSFPAFANFMTQTASSSVITSPTSQQANVFSTNTSKTNSNASTPNDALLSAITAPSPFDPKNFGALTFDPLSDDFNAQLASLSSAPSTQSSASASQSPATLEVNKAAALAGIGGKWINWTNSQEDSKESDAALISTVLAKVPDIANTPAPSSSTQNSAPALQASGSSSVVNTQAGFNSFPARAREGSVLSNTFADIEGETPEDLAARDPLATHLWRLYAKAKAGLPNGARMENITWRMMGLKLNKQKADAAAAGLVTSPQPHPESPTVQAQQNQEVSEEHEERGRRGRSAGPSSASPRDDDFAEMDWRQQSRSRSRVPQAIVGGMDWRAQSRSRSRAPNMRISMPSGPQGFQLPTYADIVETMASVSRAPQDVSVGNPSTAVLPDTSASTTGSHSRQASQAQLDMQAFERTLKQYIADGEAADRGSHNQLAKATEASATLQAGTSPSAQTSAEAPPSVLPYSYIPPAPLPLSTSNWPITTTSGDQSSSSSMPSSVLDQSHSKVQQTSAAQAIPIVAQDTANGPSTSTSAENALLQSQKSISASVEAYLSSLEHQTSVIDLPPHRHVGSVPGLFNEQELKANHHADYGFLPKLVRKTSFDASYPAQLAHEQQKQSQKKRTPHQSHGVQQQQQQQTTNTTMPMPQALQQSQDALSQSWNDPNNLFLMDNINAYLRAPAQSVPSTPSVASANIAFNNFFANMPNQSQATPFTAYTTGSPDAQQAQAQSQALAMAQAQAQTAAVEAFRRLQAAQAMQAAAQHQQQQLLQQSQQTQQSQQPAFNPYNIEGAFSPGSLPPELLAAMSPGHFGSMGMHINPSQMQNVQFPPNAFPSYGDANAGWPGSPQNNQTSPTGQYPSPEDYAAAAEEERLRSAATSRSSSITNLPSLLSQSFTSSDFPQDSTTQANAGNKSHSRQQSSVITTSVDNDSASSHTVCVNCKTTNTPLWRRDELGNPLCNACQLFRKLHGSDRPVSLHNSVVKKRNRTRNKEVVKKSTSRSQRRNSITAPERTPEDTTPEDM